MRKPFFGSAFIFAGTSIGANMLVLLLVTAQLGLPLALFMTLIFWGIMMTSAHAFTHIALHFPRGSSLFKISHKALGTPGLINSTICSVGLFGSLLSAYALGMAAIIQYYVTMPLTIIVLGCIFLCAIPLFFWHTKGIDHIMRRLFFLKAIILICAIIFIAPYSVIPVINWTYTPDAHGFFEASVLLFAAFGFHGSITAIITYAGKNKEHLRKSIIVGSLLPLIFYLIWQVLLLSDVSIQELQTIKFMTNSTRHIRALIDALSARSDTVFLMHTLNAFAFFLLLTSFLGVGIGLYSFLNDGSKYLLPVTRPQRRHLYVTCATPPPPS